MTGIMHESDFLLDTSNAVAKLAPISSASGNLRCSITNYGARLVSCIIGQPGIDVALGYPKLADYFQQPEDYMGAIVGRCANRIAGGTFSLGDKEYYTTHNEGANTLHGGNIGLHALYWNITAQTKQSVTLQHASPNGTEGFPGNLHIKVEYAITDENTLAISYQAVTDAPTPVNLSNHAYWNLTGEGSSTIEDHLLTLNAAAYTPVNAALIPTGEIAPVNGTPFDFTSARAIGRRIEVKNIQLTYGKGYDHNWALNPSDGTAVVLSSPVSGIVLELITKAPGLQFYSGNGLDSSRIGKSVKAYGRRSALVLEPQAYPDAMHHSGFPNVVLLPGQVYERRDIYRFSKRT
jgi:aldose 1-epimerase